MRRTFPGVIMLAFYADSNRMVREDSPVPEFMNKNERSWRPSWLPASYKLRNEAVVHPHDPVERADLFLAFNRGSTEMEVLNWLHATVLLLKPQHVLETGSADGLGTIALASACKANGFGSVHSIEIDPAISAQAEQLLKALGLDNCVEFVQGDSRSVLRSIQTVFDFAFFDSICGIRADECAICMERGILKGPAVFHDTSALRTRTLKKFPGEPVHSKFRQALRTLADRHFNGSLFESPLSRGLTLLLPPMLVTEPEAFSAVEGL